MQQLDYILKTTISKTSLESKHKQELDAQIRQYELYKNNFSKDIVFDPTKIGLSMFPFLLIVMIRSSLDMKREVSLSMRHWYIIRRFFCEE